MSRSLKFISIICNAAKCITWKNKHLKGYSVIHRWPEKPTSNACLYVKIKLYHMKHFICPGFKCNDSPSKLKTRIFHTIIFLVNLTLILVDHPPWMISCTGTCVLSVYTIYANIVLDIYHVFDAQPVYIFKAYIG